jgi:hypothetical protein
MQHEQEYKASISLCGRILIWRHLRYHSFRMLFRLLCGKSFFRKVIGYGLDDKDIDSSDMNYFVCNSGPKPASFAVGT